MLGWDDLLEGYLEEEEEPKFITELENPEEESKELHKAEQEELNALLEEYLNEEPVIIESEVIEPEIVAEQVTEHEEEVLTEAFASVPYSNAHSCKICFESTENGDLDDVLCCFECGEVRHRSCSSSSLCPVPLIYNFARPANVKLLRHAPWYCDSCLTCSQCDQPSEKREKCVCCRRCGRTVCFSCLRKSHGSSQAFQDPANFACDSCLQCVNCSRSQTALYADGRFCRPCYLSVQLGATCPLCSQIFHWLPVRSDFGDVAFDEEFSLCPMVECDGCAEWVHCVCEGMSEREYRRLGRDNKAKFYCFNCRKKKLKSDEVHWTISETNPSNPAFVFMFRSLKNPWKLSQFALSFAGGRFQLQTEDFFFEAETLNELTPHLVYESAEQRIKWSSALKPELIFNPLRLCARIPTALTDLRCEISKLLAGTCIRTEGFTPRLRHPPSVIEEPNRRLSLEARHLAQSMTARPGVVGLSVKTPVKLLYMQYLKTVRQDSSFKHVDAFALGLALRPSKIAGFGLFASRPFPAGSLIIEYCGEMLNSEEMVNRRDSYYNALGSRFRQSCYLFRLGDERVLDATLKGNLSRFINHSCDPNCFSRVVSFDVKDKKLLIFAKKNIEAGEEILYDYKFPEDDGEKIFCYCGSAKCRGVLN